MSAASRNTKCPRWLSRKYVLEPSPVEEPEPSGQFCLGASQHCFQLQGLPGSWWFLCARGDALSTRICSHSDLIFWAVILQSVPRDQLPCEPHCDLDTGLRGGSMFLPAVPGALPLPYSQAAQPSCPFCLPRSHPEAAPLPRPGSWNLALLPLCQPLGLSEYQLLSTHKGPLTPVLSQKVCISVLKNGFLASLDALKFAAVIRGPCAGKLRPLTSLPFSSPSCSLLPDIWRCPCLQADMGTALPRCSSTLLKSAL